MLFCSYKASDARYLQLTSPGIGIGPFSTWLQESGIDLQGDRAQYVFSKFDADNDSLLTVTEYVDKRLQPGDHLCHTPDDMDQAAIAFAGCSCNPIASPAVGACPPGRTLPLTEMPSLQTNPSALCEGSPSAQALLSSTPNTVTWADVTMHH